MSFIGDAYAPYVLGAYAGTALILGALVWASVSANARARRELEGLERERRR